MLARSISKRDREKEEKPYKIKWLYQCFGLSKQAYYQKIKSNKVKEMQSIVIKQLIASIRKKMPRYGTEKLHLDISADLQKQGIKMGRDKFLKFARQHHLLVPKTKRCFITTDSNHMFHRPPNRIKNLAITQAEQVYVSDITYIKLDGKHAYLALVTDLYSKKIMGYKIDDNMKVSLVKEALQMAVNKRQHTRKTIIHHSDRGLQYCCPDYSEFATNRNMIMSTTEKYDLYDLKRSVKHEYKSNYKNNIRKMLWQSV